MKEINFLNLIIKFKLPLDCESFDNASLVPSPRVIEVNNKHVYLDLKQVLLHNTYLLEVSHVSGDSIKITFFTLYTIFEGCLRIRIFPVNSWFTTVCPIRPANLVRTRRVFRIAPRLYMTQTSSTISVESS